MAKYFSEDPEYTQISAADEAIRRKIVAVMEEFSTTFHHGYGGGADDGVDEDDFEDVAERIMAEFGMKG